MSVTGRVKFFKRSIAQLSSGASVSADDGTDPTVILNEHPGEAWVSTVDDGSDVVLSMSFASGYANRILIVNHNIADITITGSFEGITDIDNRAIPNGNIVITNNTKDTSYFEFNAIPNLTTLSITLGETIRAGENKTVGRIIVCEELGTFEGYPAIPQASFSQSSRNIKAKSGRELVTKQTRVLKQMNFHMKGYNHVEDINLLTTLQKSQEAFLLWACGGDQEQMRYPIEGMRLQDIYKCQTKRDLKVRQQRGSYGGLIDATINFVESL